MFFKETQYLVKSKLFLILGVGVLIFVGIMIVSMIHDGIANSFQMLLFIFTMLPVFLVPVFIIWGKLVTLYDEKGVSYQFFPFHWKMKTINWKDIQKAYIRKYKPLLEYGGWGIRYSFKGKAYNVSGNKGLQLELKNGKKILFGIKKSKKIESILDKINI